MTKYLPPALLALFAPRAPLPFKPPMKRTRRSGQGLSGVAPYVGEFEDPSQRSAPLPYTLFETPLERKARKRRQREEKRDTERDLEFAQWNPEGNASATGDAFKTLFVARLPYDAQERDVEKEFDAFGKIKAVKIVKHSKTGRSRGYAFVEYESTNAMRDAYKRGDGTRVKGRRALVDVERGRTIEGWRPRRLGGGLGKTRADKLPKEEGAPKRARSSRSRSRSRERPSTARKRSRSRSRSRDRRDYRDSDRRDRDRDRDRGGRDRRSGGGGGGGGGGDRRHRDWR